MRSSQRADGAALLERLDPQQWAINTYGRVRLAWKADRHAVVDQQTEQVYDCSGDSVAEAALCAALSTYEEFISG